MGNYLAWGVAVAAAGALALGCGGKNKKDSQDPAEVQGDTSTQVPKVDPTLCEADGKDVENYDLNEDGKPDVWKLYKVDQAGGGSTRILTCKQADLNFDGKKDYVVALNERGGVLFEKFDLDFQKGFDAFYKYEQIEGEDEKSVLYEVQRDSNFDGKYDIIEKWNIQTGMMDEVQRDSNGDLKPDVWEQYKDGQLVAILYDDEPYDGKIDRREELPEPEDETAEPTKKFTDDDEGDGDTGGDGDGDTGGDEAGGDDLN
jgi:hypothetical protein